MPFRRGSKRGGLPNCPRQPGLPMTETLRRETAEVLDRGPVSLFSAGRPSAKYSKSTGYPQIHPKTCRARESRPRAWSSTGQSMVKRLAMGDSRCSGCRTCSSPVFSGSFRLQFVHSRLARIGNLKKDTSQISMDVRIEWPIHRDGAPREWTAPTNQKQRNSWKSFAAAKTTFRSCDSPA
jgi:hypothetical protein